MTVVPSSNTAKASESPSSSVAEGAGSVYEWPITIRGERAKGHDGEGLVARVREMGQGQPVVFLHGLVGLNDHWEGAAKLIQHKSRCVMLEMPLLRLSGPQCSIESVSEMIAEFLAERIGTPAVLVGNSFGGHVAMRMALSSDASRIKGLVLTGASGLYERSILANVEIRPSRNWLAKRIGELFYDQKNVWPSDIDRAYAELSRRGGARAMVKLSRSARSDHLGDRLVKIKTPTLLIWGKQDVVTPPETAREFHEKIGGSKLVWLDRCGHAPMMEYPEAFAEHMGVFLDGLAAG